MPRSRVNLFTSDSEDTECDLFSRQTLLDKRKKQIVDNVMVLIMKWLDLNFPPRQHSHGGTTSGSSSRKRTSSDDNNDDKENDAPQRPRKRQQRDEGSGGNGDGHGERDGKGNKRPKKAAQKDEKRFACPFYKHDPENPKHSRTCRGPGWDKVHRVK